MRSVLNLIFRKQPVEYPSDSLSATVAKSVATHQAAVEDFKKAVGGLLDSHARLLDENEEFRRRRDQGKDNAN